MQQQQAAGRHLRGKAPASASPGMARKRGAKLRLTTGSWPETGSRAWAGFTVAGSQGPRTSAGYSPGSFGFFLFVFG
jgi:hypothetical protein